eukprot:Protomagalhaensia_sp_Gyna_25__3290@NODE_2989_length_788_cov_5_755674_g2497_i0_p1_GENE_NODE_2989_length_788_cov_5_755674_g2497_i0NODE_2989_length_788_cov_5_755674_g2497_i0_p1_ORF_typecomplete_len149_score8_71Promethin/PF16015_5/0_088_NODE_2989_length_788_cov_5_755674_g2497_i0259705
MGVYLTFIGLRKGVWKVVSRSPILRVTFLASILAFSVVPLLLYLQSVHHHVNSFIANDTVQLRVVLLGTMLLVMANAFKALVVSPDQQNKKFLVDGDLEGSLPTEREPLSTGSQFTDLVYTEATTADASHSVPGNSHETLPAWQGISS